MPYKRFKLQALLLLSAALLAGPAAADEYLPSAFRAFYTVPRPGPDAAMEWRLRHTEGGRILVQRTLSWMFIRVREESELEIKNGALRPLLYTYRALGRRRRVQFDWTAKQVQTEEKQSSEILPLSPGLLDPLGYSLQQRLDLQALGPGWPGGTYRLISRGKIRTVKIRNAGIEKISTPAGDFSALRIEAVTLDERNQKQGIVWHALQRDYLPVQVQWRENGKEHTALLKAISE